MKTSKYKVTLWALLCFAHSLSANFTGDFERVISEEFAIAANGELEILNRYGHIDIKAWDNASVKIDVTIKVDARNEDQAKEVFDRININFSNSTSFVRAETVISESRGWSKFWDSGSKFEITYNVFVPTTVAIDLENKYGDIYVGEKEADANIVVKYGNLRMDGISGNLSLDMGYGKGSVSRAGDIDLVVKYSSLRFGDVGNARIESKYSGFEFGEMGDVRTATSYDNYRIERAGTFANLGKYDDFAIGEAESVNMDSRYSQLSIDKLNKSADLTFKYGGIELNAVQPGFTNIEIECEYAGVKVGVDPAARFRLEAYSVHCPIRYSDLEVFHEVISSSESTVKGYRGAKDAPAGITIRMKYGSFRLN